MKKILFIVISVAVFLILMYIIGDIVSRPDPRLVELKNEINVEKFVENCALLENIGFELYKERWLYSSPRDSVYDGVYSFIDIYEPESKNTTLRCIWKETESVDMFGEVRYHKEAIIRNSQIRIYVVFISDKDYATPMFEFLREMIDTLNAG